MGTVFVPPAATAPLAPMLHALFLTAALAPDVLVFDAPGFPRLGGLTEAPRIEDARVVASVEDLVAELSPDDVLVWWHGASVPARAWSELRAFLEGGGRWLHLGGEPWTRPVHEGEDTAWILGSRTLRLLEDLRLDRIDVIPVGGGEIVPRAEGAPALAVAEVPPGSLAYALDPRFSDDKDFAHEDGSPGARDARLTTLTHVYREDRGRLRPIAAGSIAIDRLRGRFAGGRWVLRLLSTAPSSAEIDALVEAASQPTRELRVDPLYGSFHEGERPAVRITLHRPRPDDREQEQAVTVHLEHPDGAARALPPVRLRAAESASVVVPLPSATAPGLYRVKAALAERPPVETGFWVRDDALFHSGDELGFDGYTLRRNGRPEPVVGTTTMSRTVHRDFLFEPNAAVWDETFAELSGIGVRLIRTGVWSGYRRIALEPQALDEGFLRALEAYYLTARRHGIAVLFTFFAFVPESFGGENPYFDPRSLEGQRAYVRGIVERFAGCREMLWDLINEPSFSSPDHLWQCRPNGDRFETAAFLDWLRERHGDAPEGFEARVRERWRLAPDDPVGLPDERDFAEAQVFGDARPYRAKEYVHFAQDAFRDWALDLRATIRDAGSTAAVTVGQDEGGLLERPSPLYHAEAVDFTSIHTWWFNDRLLWDAAMARVPGVPLLVSETGIMHRERLDGDDLRDAFDKGRLAARKLAASFAGGAFGTVLWCYETNPFMASDNEVAIGLKRVDGSHKPEHDAFRRCAEFVYRHREWFDSPAPSDVALVAPSSDGWGPRAFQKEGTRRSLEALGRLGIVPYVVPEHRPERLGTPRVIVLPACRGIADEAWAAIESAVEEGAVLLASGWFETDDAGLPRERLGLARDALARACPDPTAQGAQGAQEATVFFAADVVDSWYRALGDPGSRSLGAGRIVHHPLPLEWSDDAAALRRHYERVLSPRASRLVDAPVPSGIELREWRFRKATLVVALSERLDETAIRLGERDVRISPGGANMVLFDADGAVLGSMSD